MDEGQPQTQKSESKWKLPSLDLVEIASYLPSVQKPEGKINFKEKMKWTGLILILFFALGSITVFGVDPTTVARFEFLEIVFGSRFGSIMTLGIGPIVTASIILQLLVGSQIIPWDLKSPDGKGKFTAAQKIMAILFSFFEAMAYVFAGAVPPTGGDPVTAGLVILQLAMGGIIVIFMDEVVTKWGIGSGVSLFIAAGVSKTIIVRLFNPLTSAGTIPTAAEPAAGLLPSFVSTLGAGEPTQALVLLFPLIATLLVFAIVTFAQGMKIEIPMAITLPFGKFGARRWPLKFIYTSNIPVILVAAVLANLQVGAKILAERGLDFIGVYDSAGQAIGGLALYMVPPTTSTTMVVSIVAALVGILFGFLALLTLKKYVLRLTIVGAVIGGIIGSLFLVGTLGLPSLDGLTISRSIVFTLLYVVGSMIFAKFWVATSGMDAHSVAEQFKSSFFSIPGFRRDPRVIEGVLERYIPALTILGGGFVGLLAAFADLTNAIGSGTGILLTVMIVYQFYEQIMQQHYDELPEFVKNLIGGQ